jgi:hypothetical protein
MKLKFLAASVASLSIIALSPAAWASPVCDNCYSGCMDAYGQDDSITGYRALAQCVGFCNDSSGTTCGFTIAQ